MISQKRPTLTLNGHPVAEDDRPFDLAVYDVLLPCRRFGIEHKVAVLGRVSLTAEFVLRLLKSADGIPEMDAAEFFGFDRRDMAFVLSEVEGPGYVERREGRLWLTSGGLALFPQGAAQPQLFDVEKRHENVGFDLLSLAPVDPKFLDEFERRLPELPISNPEFVSAATAQIPSAFRRFYLEIGNRRERNAETRKSLYSIDAVTPGDRFSSTVRVNLRSTGLHPSVGELDLGEWRSEQEQLDRESVLNSASAFVDQLRVARRSDDGAAYGVLLEVAPEFLKDFTRKDGLAIERYYRDALTRAGDVRSDRPTIPILGSLFARTNVRRFAEVLQYALRATDRPSSVLWLSPMLSRWGSTRALPELLRHLKASLRRNSNDDPDGTSPTTVCLVAGRPDGHLDKAFDQMAISDAPRFPPALEVLLIPKVAAVVSVHAPILEQLGLPVPLGIMSFDQRVVTRVQDYLSSRCSTYVHNLQSAPAIFSDLAHVDTSE